MSPIVMRLLNGECQTKDCKDRTVQGGCLCALAAGKIEGQALDIMRLKHEVRRLRLMLSAGGKVVELAPHRAEKTPGPSST